MRLLRELDRLQAAKGHLDEPTLSELSARLRVPLAALYKSLKGKVKELHRIGDCVAPRKVDMAIWDGHKVGREI